MTIPENYAEDYERTKSGAVQQLTDWLRKARAERKNRREEERYQAFLRRVDPAVMEELGSKGQSDTSLITQAARMPPLLFLPGRNERQD